MAVNQGFLDREHLRQQNWIFKVIRFRRILLSDYFIGLAIVTRYAHGRWCCALLIDHASSF